MGKQETMTREQWEKLAEAEGRYRAFRKIVNYSIDQNYDAFLQLQGPYFIDGRDIQSIRLTRLEVAELLAKRRRLLEDEIRGLGGSISGQDK